MRLALDRLNLQHCLWKEKAEYLLNPTVAVGNEGENLRVADVGTGTGYAYLTIEASSYRFDDLTEIRVFVVDLSRHFQSCAQLDGFGIDISQAQPKQWLASNRRM